MVIKTVDRIDIHVLPENAKCLFSDDNPMYMDECPIKHAVCVPEICDFYTEEDGKE